MLRLAAVSLRKRKLFLLIMISVVNLSYSYMREMVQENICRRQKLHGGKMFDEFDGDFV